MVQAISNDGIECILYTTSDNLPNKPTTKSALSNLNTLKRKRNPLTACKSNV